MNRSVLGLTTALLMSALIIGGCGSNQDDHDTSLKVRTITIGEEAGMTSAGYSGTIKNRTETNLAFQVGGRVINKFVSVGTAVQAGQVIAQINGADTASQLQQAQASLNLSNNQNSYTTLVAPDSGIITALNVEAGQVVAAGQAIGTLAAGHEPEAVIALPEQEMSKIHPGSTATITFWALPDVKVQGIVREISPVPDPVARTYMVKITLQNPPKEVQLGMTINAILNQTDTTDISIPLTALVKDKQGNNAVYVIRDNKAHLVPIQTGEFGNNSVIVKNGLAKGDIVITAGTQQLQEGTAVHK